MILRRVLLACCLLVFCLGTVIGCSKPPSTSGENPSNEPATPAVETDAQAPPSVTS